MWHIFGHKPEEEEKEEEPTQPSNNEQPDLEMLNNHCYKCDFCSAVHTLIDQPPLSLVKCTECGSPNFIPLLIKDYWLYKPLGSGGMGSVYKAMYNINPELEFALKILPREKKEDPVLSKALLNEATIGQSLGRHPHLIAVTDYGHYKDEYFIALEFCEGIRLDQVIDMPEPINQKYILLWGLQLLSAEQQIWDSGYLYRDMKPQNIMIDPNKNVRLYDYGLCVDKNNFSNTSSNIVQGSPLYMPPERIVGLDENMSSEIYSIGMVMYHALAKKTYYSATDAFELAKKHVTSMRTSTVSSKLPQHVSPHIAEILDKMLPRNPADRYQSFKEAALAIKQAYKKL